MRVIKRDVHGMAISNDDVVLVLEVALEICQGSGLLSRISIIYNLQSCVAYLPYTLQSQIHKKVRYQNSKSCTSCPTYIVNSISKPFLVSMILIILGKGC